MKKEMMQSIIDQYSEQAKSTCKVYVKIVNGAGQGSLAYTIWVPIFNMGYICVSEDKQNRYYLSDQEMKYVLAHEFAHIYLKHNNLQKIGGIFSDFLHSTKEPLIKFFMSAVRFRDKLMECNGGLPFGEEIKRNFEYAADEYAVRLLSKQYEFNDAAKEIAVNCLTKLSEGNTSHPSHIGKSAINKDREIPLMTIQDRIDRINNLSLDSYE